MIYPYNRRQAVEYAKKWAYSRNPLFFDFTEIGGNCTNFVSQCVFAGCCKMNFTPDIGWYYISPEDRAAAWTGVEFFYNFFISNTGDGPFGIEVELNDVQIGDVIQLGDANGDFYHTLLVVGIFGGEVYLAAQSIDAYNKPLSAYNYNMLRCIHIVAYNSEGGKCNCFDELYSGTELKFCIDG